MKNKKYLCIVFLLVIILLVACDPPAPGRSPNGDSVTPMNSGMEVEVVTPTPTPASASAPPFNPVTFTAAFDPVNSGILCLNDGDPPIVMKNGETPSRIGEIGDTFACDGYWTFDMSSFPSSGKVVSVIFTPGQCTKYGNPFARDNKITFEAVERGTLDVDDWFEEGYNSVVLDDCPATIDLTSYVQSRFVGSGLNRIMIRSNPEQGVTGNGIDDYLSYRSTTPTLIITFNNTP